MYAEVSSKTKTTETQDLTLLNQRFAEANNYLVLLRNVRIQQVRANHRAVACARVM